MEEVKESIFKVDDVLDPILNRLSELEDKIDKLPKTTTSTNRTKKDGE